MNDKAGTFFIITTLVFIFLAFSAISLFADGQGGAAQAPELQRNPGQPPAEGAPAGGPEDKMSDQPVSEPNASPEANAPIERVDTAPSGANASPLPEEAIKEGVKIDKERISLDLKGIDINELFRILSLKMGVTIVPAKTVSGRINIFLNNLTFEDALDVIMLSQDLACERKEGIINIMTASDYEHLYGKKFNEKREFKSLRLNYAKPSAVFSAISQVKSDVGKIIVDEGTGVVLLIDIPEKLELMEKTIKDLDKPPQTEIFDIKYAKPADLKTQLASAITPGTGEVFVDERSTKAVISDLPDKMKKIRRMVSAFDAETRQVFIEAEIMQITLKSEYQRGINWEQLMESPSWKGLDFKGTYPVSPSFSPSPTLTGSNLQMAIGALAVDYFTATIKMLESFGNTRILSRPRLAVINNQEAKILVGSREAYVTQSQSQAESTTVTSESVQFVDVGVKLDIVPQINKDGYITMKIKPEVSSVRETLTTALNSKIPIVDTSEAETTVKVKDGTMIMIAGLMKEDRREDKNGFPFLSKIPVLSLMFGARADQNKKTELVIFITPHIMSGDALVKNSEPEKFIPPEMMPDDMKKANILRKIEDENNNFNANKNKALSEKDRPGLERSGGTQETGTHNIEDKIKGLKEY
ncbi:MAG: hypothetical protein NTU54_04475 [Candidatus Omnitrophica bacterium]|nr:hypothetical protein [Candidatus Omnitrophota bacterium]